MKEIISHMITPMLLGNNKCSRRLARRLFWRYGIRSNIFDVCRSIELDLMLSAVFSPLPQASDAEFILLGLNRFADEREDNTCLIVPCSSKFAELINQNRQGFERRFIIRTPNEIEKSLNHGAKMPYERKV